MARPRGRPTDRSSDETRAAIIAAAHRLFGEAGYAGVAMSRLAGEAGLTVRALYHYFPSKRELFQAATDEALGRFGHEIATRVFVHEALPDRLRGFVDVYRAMYASEREVLAFIGMVLVDAVSEDRALGEPSGGTSTVAADLHSASIPVQALNGALVDAAIARGELHTDVDREAAMHLLGMFGMGLSLAALDGSGTFPRMLDALDRLTDGSLFT